MESTPNEKRRFTDYLHGQMDGSGPAPSGPTRPDAKLTDAIKAKLAGSDTPTAGDTADAPAGVDADVWSRAQAASKDPQSPDYELGTAVVTLAQRLADLEGAPQP
jgi:hypothetical protein